MQSHFDAYFGNYAQNETAAALNAAKELHKHDISTNDLEGAGKQENMIAEHQGNEVQQAEDYQQAANYFEQYKDRTDEIAALQNAGSDYQNLGNSENGVNGQKATEYWQDTISDYQQEANLDEQLGCKAVYKAAGNVLMNEEVQVLETWDTNWNTANGN